MEPFEQPGRLQGTIWTAREATGKHVDSPAGARYLYGQPRRLQGRLQEAFGQPGALGRGAREFFTGGSPNSLNAPLTIHTRARTANGPTPASQTIPFSGLGFFLGKTLVGPARRFPPKA